jgi:hypothetical protein
MEKQAVVDEGHHWSQHLELLGWRESEIFHEQIDLAPAD